MAASAPSGTATPTCNGDSQSPASDLTWEQRHLATKRRNVSPTAIGCASVAPFGQACRVAPAKCCASSSWVAEGGKHIGILLEVSASARKLAFCRQRQAAGLPGSLHPVILLVAVSGLRKAATPSTGAWLLRKPGTAVLGKRRCLHPPVRAVRPAGEELWGACTVPPRLPKSSAMPPTTEPSIGPIHFAQRSWAPDTTCEQEPQQVMVREGWSQPGGSVGDGAMRGCE